MYKTILVGDTNTGKSNLLFWILKGKKREDNYPTVGIEVGAKAFEIQRLKTDISVQFWDTAGQERFRSVCLQGAKAALLVFDITSRESFYNLGTWIKQIRENVQNSNVIICLLGNKIDRQQFRQVSKQQAQQFVVTNNLSFYKQISAQDGQGIPQSIQKLLEHLTDYKPSIPKQSIILTSQPIKPQEGCKC